MASFSLVSLLTIGFFGFFAAANCNKTALNNVESRNDFITSLSTSSRGGSLSFIRDTLNDIWYAVSFLFIAAVEFSAFVIYVISPGTMSAIAYVMLKLVSVSSVFGYVFAPFI